MVVVCSCVYVMCHGCIERDQRLWLKYDSNYAHHRFIVVSDKNPGEKFIKKKS